jgi:hypothetical protein
MAEPGPPGEIGRGQSAQRRRDRRNLRLSRGLGRHNGSRTCRLADATHAPLIRRTVDPFIVPPLRKGVHSRRVRRDGSMQT